MMMKPVVFVVVAILFILALFMLIRALLKWYAHNQKPELVLDKSALFKTLSSVSERGIIQDSAMISLLNLELAYIRSMCVGANPSDAISTICTDITLLRDTIYKYQDYKVHIVKILIILNDLLERRSVFRSHMIGRDMNDINLSNIENAINRVSKALQDITDAVFAESICDVDQQIAELNSFIYHEPLPDDRMN